MCLPINTEEVVKAKPGLMCQDSPWSGSPGADVGRMKAPKSWTEGARLECGVSSHLLQLLLPTPGTREKQERTLRLLARHGDWDCSQGGDG